LFGASTGLCGKTGAAAADRKPAGYSIYGRKTGYGINMAIIGSGSHDVKGEITVNLDALLQQSAVVQYNGG
jgi:hypothetical protein